MESDTIIKVIGIVYFGKPSRKERTIEKILCKYGLGLTFSRKPKALRTTYSQTDIFHIPSIWALTKVMKKTFFRSGPLPERVQHMEANLQGILT